MRQTHSKVVVIMTQINSELNLRQDRNKSCCRIKDSQFDEVALLSDFITHKMSFYLMIAGQLQTFASLAGSEEIDKLVKKIDLRPSSTQLLMPSRLLDTQK